MFLLCGLILIVIDVYEAIALCLNIDFMIYFSNVNLLLKFSCSKRASV